MLSLRKSSQALLLILASQFPVAAAMLKWDQTSIEREVPFDSSNINQSFFAKNEGNTPIFFKTVKTSCGCTVANIEKKTLAPGEVGEVAVKIDVTKVTGESVKLIVVETDEAGLGAYDLTVTIKRNSPYDAYPATLIWNKSEGLSEKSLVFKKRDSTPASVNIKRAISLLPEQFEVRLEKGVSPDSNVVYIRPLTDNFTRLKPVTLILDYDGKVVNSRMGVTVTQSQ